MQVYTLNDIMELQDLFLKCPKEYATCGPEGYDPTDRCMTRCAKKDDLIDLEDLNKFTDAMKKTGNFIKNNGGAIGGIGMAAVTGNIGGAVAGGMHLA